MKNEEEILKEVLAKKTLCRMKKRNPDGGMPVDFGTMYQNNFTTIFFDDVRFKQEYESLADLLADGWIVD